MLHTARSAQTANRLAPRHTRRSVGTAMVCGLTRARFWLHPRGLASSTGTSVSSVMDWSGSGTSITQTTVSKQPVTATIGGVPCFKFDGVNDALAVAQINFSATQALSIIVAEYRASTAGGTVWELTINQNNSAVGAGVFGNDGGANTFAYSFQGNVGYQYGVVSSTISRWRAWSVVFDKSQAAATEAKIFTEGAKVTSFVSQITTENTNFFANDFS